MLWLVIVLVKTHSLDIIERMIENSFKIWMSLKQAFWFLFYIYIYIYTYIYISVNKPKRKYFVSWTNNEMNNTEFTVIYSFVHLNLFLWEPTVYQIAFWLLENHKETKLIIPAFIGESLSCRRELQCRNLSIYISKNLILGKTNTIM